MTANPTLVKMRGIDEESVRQINLLHEKLDKLMSRAGLDAYARFSNVIEITNQNGTVD